MAGDENFSNHFIKATELSGHLATLVSPGTEFKRISSSNYHLDISDQSNLKKLWQEINKKKIPVTHIIYCKTLSPTYTYAKYDTIEETLVSGYIGLSFLAKYLVENGQNENIDILILSNHIARLTESDKIDSLKATILAPAKIIPSEISTLRSKVLDIPYPFKSDTESEHYFSLILGDILKMTEDALVAFRFKERWIPCFDELPLAKDSVSRAKIAPGKTYLVVGGFGGMGFAVSKNITLEHGANIILLHRSNFPEKNVWNKWLLENDNNEETSKKIQTLLEIEATGAKIDLFQVNVSSDKEVKNLAKSLKNKYKAINGLIWAAGEVDYGGIIQNRSKDEMLKYLYSKVHGVLLFEKYFKFGLFDFVALFSSIGNTFYHIKFGQVAYNAANEFLDHFALASQNKYGNRVFSINWCDWKDVGMTVKINKTNLNTTDIDHINSKILHGVTPAQGVAIFQNCLKSEASSFTIYPGDIADAIDQNKDQYREVNTSLQNKSDGIEKASDNLEEDLLFIFRSFFGKPDITENDNFFEVGGDSLKAMTLVARINKKLGLDLLLGDMYKYPSVMALLSKIDKKRVSEEISSIPKARKKKYYTTSAEQRRMYFLQKLEGANKSYNESKAFWINGKLNKNLLEESFNKLIERHESLRTSFVLHQNSLKQVISKKFDFKLENIPSKKSDLAETIDDFIRPFDLSLAPLIRVGIMKKSSEKHLIIIDSHHIVLDGVSKSILFKELISLYTHQKLGENGLQYKDYAEWQQSAEEKIRIKRQQNFWVNKFSDPVTPFELPTDKSRPSIRENKAEVLNCQIGSKETLELRSMAKKEGTTVFTVLVAMINVFLGKLCDQDDIAIGIPVTERSRKELDHMVGMFVNTLVLRNFPEKNLQFNEFIDQVNSDLLSSLENKSFPLQELVKILDIDRNQNRNPLFDIMMTYEKAQNFKNSDIDIVGQPITKVSARFDITFFIVETEKEISVKFVYASDLFEESTIARFIEYFENIVKAVVTNPNVKLGDIDMLPFLEKQKLLRDFNETKIAYEKDIDAQELFLKQVKKNGSSPAIVYKAEKITYSELDKWANQIIHEVSLKSESSKKPIALLFQPSIELIVAIIVAIKMGRPFVNLVSDIPIERKKHILSDSGADLLLTYEHLAFEAIGILAGFDGLDKHVIGKRDSSKAPSRQFYRRHQQNCPIYLIYTSGTTGEPKGVEISNRGITNMLNFYNQLFQIKQGDRFSQIANLGFDASVFEILPSLCLGGTLHIAPEDERLDPQLMKMWMQESEIQIAFETPAIVKYFLEDPKFLKNNSLKIVNVAGDRFDYEPVQELPFKLYNLYGPTEDSIWSSYQQMEFDKPLGYYSVGKPIANKRLYILSKENRLLPLGVPGELCISGEGLAIGYVNNEILTQEKFVSNPFVPNDRLYRTGDLARWRADGNIEFLGRIDDQVKINGFRIELGEISYVLASHKSIRQALVLPKKEEGNVELISYYLAEKDVSDLDLTDFLLEKLPAYMIPKHFIKVENFPTQSNGKIDIKALPAPVLKFGDVFSEPQSEREKVLTNVWGEVLRVSKIGTRDNFFSIGGDSIKSIQISSRLRVLGFKIGVKDILTSPTIQELAPKLEYLQDIEDQSKAEGTIKLGPIQHWFFNGVIKNKSHFNQSVLLHFPHGIKQDRITKIFSKILENHDALRLTFTIDKTNSVEGAYSVEDKPIDLAISTIKGTKDALAQINSYIQKFSGSLDLANGPLLKLVLFESKVESYLLIIIHHLVVDGVSWRILLEDIEILHQQAVQNQILKLPLKTASFQLWTDSLAKYGQTKAFQKTAKYWEAFSIPDLGHIPCNNPEGDNTYQDVEQVSLQLDPERTKILLNNTKKRFDAQISEMILAAFLLGVRNQYGMDTLQIAMESHGRVSFMNSPDISNTVGWFTTLYPVFLKANSDNLTKLVKSIGDTLKSIPNDGFDYLLHEQYGHKKDSIVHEPKIVFNYLGEFFAEIPGRSFGIIQDFGGENISRGEKRPFDLELSGIIFKEQLQISLKYAAKRYDSSNMELLMVMLGDSLNAIIEQSSEIDKNKLSNEGVVSLVNSTSTGIENLYAKYNAEAIYRLSPMQEGMLFHSLLNKNSEAYFEQMTCRIKGTFHKEIAEKSMNYLIDRHSILRTIFVQDLDEYPVQVVLKERKIDLLYHDLRPQLSDGSEETLVKRIYEKDRSLKFELDREILVRITVLQLANEEFEIIWSHHHIIMDGWSMGIMMGEFEIVYNFLETQKSISLPKAIPYQNYITYLQGAKDELASNFWRNYLDQYENTATIPKRYMPLNHQMSEDFGVMESVVSAATTKRLLTKCQDLGITLNTLVQVAWGIVLCKYNNTKDVIYGAVVSGRPPEIPGIENMVGICINTLPVRIRLTEDGISETVFKQVQNSALERQEFQYKPLVEIQQMSDLGSQLFDHILVFENYPLSNLLLENKKPGKGKRSYSIVDVNVHERTNYNFTLLISPEEKLKFKAVYNKGSYEPSMIEQVLNHLQKTLDELTKRQTLNLSQLNFVSEERKKTLAEELITTTNHCDGGNCILDVLDIQIQKTPLNIALRHIAGEISYQDLNTKINSVTGYLQNDQGIVKSNRIGVVLDREVNLIPIIYGILQAGGVYVPIDSKSPKDKIKTIIEDAELKLIVTRDKYINKIPTNSTEILNLDEQLDGIYAHSPPVTIVAKRAEDLAYIIYTSGSTGVPKGVMIAHHSLINILNCMDGLYPVKKSDSYLLKTNHIFDVSLAEIFGWFHSGGSLTILPSDLEGDPSKLEHFIYTYGISHINFVPSMFSPFLDHLESNPVIVDRVVSLRYIFLAGEELPLELVNRFKALGTLTLLANIYGPTEATIYSSGFPIPRGVAMQKIPIGKALYNIELYIFDHWGSLQADGAPGELYIGGDGVALGYLNQPELTAQQFIEHPFSTGKKLYRTGDLVRINATGQIEYLGRMDSQIKLRGFRIEMGEIEHHLKNYKGISDGVVTLKITKENKVLVAYYVSKVPVDEVGLRNYLGERLPYYMIPSFYIQIKEIPIGANGKLNRKVLPDIDVAITIDLIEPSGDQQEKLVEIWSRILEIEPHNIGLHSNFFELGGHSINIIRLTREINKVFDSNLNVAQLFRLHTIKSIENFLIHGDQGVKKIATEVEESQNDTEDNLNLISDLIKE